MRTLSAVKCSFALALVAYFFAPSLPLRTRFSRVPSSPLPKSFRMDDGIIFHIGIQIEGLWVSEVSVRDGCGNQRPVR